MESSSSSLLLSSYTGNNKRSKEADLEAVSSAEVEAAKRMRPEDLLDLLDDHTDTAAADDLASVMRSLEEEICTGDLAPPQPELGFLEMGADMTVNCVHPGIVRTRLNRNREGLITDLVLVLLSKLLKTIPQAAATTCYAAVHPRLAGVSDRYFSDCNEALPSTAAARPRSSGRRRRT